eukprot:CAMPEP_0172671812 /NCGR_PEP_ID=MMETSP1074-20121228/11152_1 /TAXON_ID=2916 /ORGANISM="Ceratium fusus, Strain PA161109" /LENGTH=85 /DNA_ID=CAMNT_0013488919 /DNA_START=25 /DNA_END=283 /DNA_ORIENTATION=-
MASPQPDQESEAKAELPLFFVEGPDGLINGLAGADSVAPPPSKPRLQCFHCRTLLEFAIGASYVQCYHCSRMNAVFLVQSLEAGL